MYQEAFLPCEGFAMRGRNFGFVCAASFLLLSVLVAGPARAPAVTTTIHVKGETMTSTAANPCTAANATVTITFNGVFHVTVISATGAM